MQLTHADLLKLYELMLLTRRLDERMWILNRQGEVMTVASGQGQEAAQVGSAYALEPEDYVALSYREHGVAVTRGMDAYDILAYALHRDSEPNSRGRQITGHYSSRKLRILSGSSPIATQIPHAVGAALTLQVRREPYAVICYFGDGATSKGDFHEALNWAGVQKLPVVFFCQNNGWAISVPQQRQMAISDIADRAAGYGMPGDVVDGNDVVAVYRVTAAALARARRGDGPTLIEAKTTRLLPHTSEDDDRRYRSREEVEAERKRDPLVVLTDHLRRHSLWSGEWATQLDAQIAQLVDDAYAYARRQPLPRGEDVMTHVYGNPEQS